jgi:hypothetical protein
MHVYIVYRTFTIQQEVRWNPLKGSDDVGFNPSTQRLYRRLIYYLYIT